MTLFSSMPVLVPRSRGMTNKVWSTSEAMPLFLLPESSMPIVNLPLESSALAASAIA